MSTASRQVTVGQVAVLLADLVSTSGGASVVLLNSDAAFTVFVGGSDVTTGNGVALKPGASLGPLRLAAADAIYAKAGGSTATATVFVFRYGT